MRGNETLGLLDTDVYRACRISQAPTSGLSQDIQGLEQLLSHRPANASLKLKADRQIFPPYARVNEVPAFN